MPAIFDPVNVVLLAAAIFIAWRFFLVLGQRDGAERPRPDIARPPSESAPSAASPSGPSPAPEILDPVWKGFAKEASPEAKGLESIAGATPEFSVAPFLAGAKQAYEMIQEAYAKGDRHALKPLLSKEVFDNFSSAIAERERRSERMVFQFVGVKSATVKEAGLTGRNARITLRFISEMISATLASNGNVIDGDSKQVREVRDDWTFERDTGSRDPNWKLVGTADSDI